MGDPVDDALVEIRSDIDRLEDNIHVEYPVADTCGGAAQRVRIEVPSPASLITVGARGTATAEGLPLGPGGIAIRTAEHFGAQITGSACFATGELSIFHATGLMRVLSQSDVGIAAKTALRVGTASDHLELTAGQVQPPDPAFTVNPAMSVPVPASVAVDTATPRRSTEGWKKGLEAVWAAVEARSFVNSIRSLARTSVGVQMGSLHTFVRDIVNIAKTGWSGASVLHDGAKLAASVFDISTGIDAWENPAPTVKIHGEGGVSITSPEGISAFAPALSFTARTSASLKATAKVSIKTLGLASLYGGAMASLSSEGPVGIKSETNMASVSGRYADISGKDVASVRSDGSTTVSGKDRVVATAPSVAIGGTRLVGISSARHVHTAGKAQNKVSSEQQVLIQSDRAVDVHGGERVTIGKTTGSGNSRSLTTGIQIEEGRITFDVGDRGRFYRWENGRVQILRSRFTEGEVSIHGLVVRR